MLTQKVKKKNKLKLILPYRQWILSIQYESKRKYITNEINET